jgi:hypothetical protein
MLAAPASAAGQPLKYGVWLPFWKAQDGAEDVSVNLDKLSEVSPFSYEIGTNGKMRRSIMEAGTGGFRPSVTSA